MRSIVRERAIINGLFLTVFAFGMFFPIGAKAQTQIKPRIMIIFDTSGSMGFDIDAEGDVYTWGDGSWDPYGGRFCCPGLGNSRLFHAKEAMRQMIFATGDIAFGLMKFAAHYRSTVQAAWTYDYGYRYNQDASDFDALRYQGGCYDFDHTANGTPNTNGGIHEWLCADFPDATLTDNRGKILMWLDHHEFKSDGSGDPDDAPVGSWSYDGKEQELRALGGTPLADSLDAVRIHLVGADGTGGVIAADTAMGKSCRPYSVILLTDGEESCGGDEVQAAEDLYDAHPTTGQKIKTWVIGLAASSGLITDLNNIASAGSGNTETAFPARSQDELSEVLYTIIEESLLIESCNYIDDDCDGETDEDFRSDRTYCDPLGGPLPNTPGKDIPALPQKILCVAGHRKPCATVWMRTAMGKPMKIRRASRAMTSFAAGDPAPIPMRGSVGRGENNVRRGVTPQGLTVVGSAWEKSGPRPKFATVKTTIAMDSPMKMIVVIH